jgi:carboxypeptidase family protein
MSKTTLQNAAVATLLVLLFSFPVLAQTGAGTFGTILGTVNDETGAVVPKVTVTATNEKTGVGRSTATSSEGDFQIPALLPGS